jgi:putative FmdB family regulatory protein
MPVFEYRCLGCEAEFERLVFSLSATVRCPECSTDEVEKRPSVFGMSGVEKQVGSSSCSGCTTSSCKGCASA